MNSFLMGIFAYLPGAGVVVLVMGLLAPKCEKPPRGTDWFNNPDAERRWAEHRDHEELTVFIAVFWPAAMPIALTVLAGRALFALGKALRR